MASIPVKTSNPVVLKSLLFDKYKILVMPLNGNCFIRYFINAYDSQEDLNILYKALKVIMATTDFIEV